MKRRSKELSEKKDDAMRVRVSTQTKVLFQQAATKEGLTLSSWVITTCLKAVSS